MADGVIMAAGGRGGNAEAPPPAAVDDEFSGDDTKCSNHPYRKNFPGGICALCLQEKLGNLVSFSSSSFFIASSSSSSPSFRSDVSRSGHGLRLSSPATVTVTEASSSTSNGAINGGGYRLPFLLTQRKKKKPSNPRRRGFWSFLHQSHRKTDKSSIEAPSVVASCVVIDETDSSPNSNWSNTTSFGRKVSRSRSVGCGSRSFSGDFFGRISTGFGDCKLRRTESQREGKLSGDRMREKVRCGGLFRGFKTTSSSSSSPSSSYMVSNNSVEEKPCFPVTTPGRSKSWGWGFGTPMRAFGKKDLNGSNKNKNTIKSPNLAAIPSLLELRG